MSLYLFLDVRSIYIEIRILGGFYLKSLVVLLMLYLQGYRFGIASLVITLAPLVLSLMLFLFVQGLEESIA